MYHFCYVHAQIGIKCDTIWNYVRARVDVHIGLMYFALGDARQPGNISSSVRI